MSSTEPDALATRHPQAKVEHDGFSAQVDAGIAPLIVELWRAGADTYLSCQDNPVGRIWIAFPTAGHAVCFLNVVANAGDLEAEDQDVESLTNRMATEWVPEGDWEAFERDRAWHYATSSTDWTVRYPEDDAGALGSVRSGPADFDFTISVRFPRTDYQEVLARLRAFNARDVP